MSFTSDGIIYHPIKSCRTVSTGIGGLGAATCRKRHDVPSLFIESDMMDRRVVSEAQLKNRVDAFFEGLASEKRRRQQPGERSEPGAYAPARSRARSEAAG